jgi:hypothetical protein
LPRPLDVVCAATSHAKGSYAAPSIAIRIFDVDTALEGTSMNALDLLNLDVLLARSVLLRADYVQVQSRIRDSLSRRNRDLGSGPADEDFDELIHAMSRSLSADARYLCTLSFAVRGIIERAKATA